MAVYTENSIENTLKYRSSMKQQIPHEISIQRLGRFSGDATPIIPVDYSTELSNFKYFCAF